MVIAPFIIQLKPQWAGNIEKTEEAVQKILDSQVPPKVQKSPLQAAWDKDKDVESLQKLKFLYLKTQLDAASQFKDLGELYKSFLDDELKLGLKDKLKELRGVTRTEWAKAIPEIPPAALTVQLRARIVGFLTETNKSLDKLE